MPQTSWAKIEKRFDEQFYKLEYFDHKSGVIYSKDGSMKFGNDGNQLTAIKIFLRQALIDQIKEVMEKIEQTERDEEAVHKTAQMPSKYEIIKDFLQEKLKEYEQ